MGRRRKQTQVIPWKDKASFTKVCRQADQGDEKALTAIRKWLDETPSARERIGDLARTAEESLVRLTSKSPLIQEGLHTKLNALRREVGGLEPTPLEDLLARRIAACWLQVHYLEAIYADNVENHGLGSKWSESLQRSMDRAQRRYLSAIKTLVQVRRLLGPMVQVNIAEKQVNIARSS